MPSHLECCSCRLPLHEEHGPIKLCKYLNFGHVKLLLMVGLHMVYKLGITASENKIIDIKHKDDEVVTESLGINISVSMTSRKSII